MIYNLVVDYKFNILNQHDRMMFCNTLITSIIYVQFYYDNGITRK